MATIPPRDATATWWLDLTLAAMLLGATVSWSAYLVAGASALDLVVVMVLLLAAAAYGCHGVADIRDARGSAPGSPRVPAALGSPPRRPPGPRSR